MHLKALAAKARELEESRKHRFSTFTYGRLSLPSPRKDRSTGYFYFECRDCQRQLYLIGEQIMGTAIDGGHCTGG